MIKVLPGTRKTDDSALLPCGHCGGWTRHLFDERELRPNKRINVWYRCKTCRTRVVWGAEHEDEDDRCSEQGARLRILRKSRGLTQIAVCNQLGVTPHFLCALESGSMALPPGRVAQLAIIYGVTEEEILGGI